MSEETNNKPTGRMKPMPGKTRKKIVIHYTKAPLYRTVHADGVFGGIVPSGKSIVMGFFSERSSLPDKVYVPIKDDGGIAMEDGQDRDNRRPGIMREIEANVVMDYDAAKALLKWLGEKVDIMEAEQTSGKRLLRLDPKGLVDRP